METKTLTVTEFLLARISEEEGLARCATGDRWSAHERSVKEDGWLIAGNLSPMTTDTRHIARHDPKHVLAECEAKRLIVARFTALTATVGYDWEVAGTLEEVLLVLASVYADHPSYREDWRP